MTIAELLSGIEIKRYHGSLEKNIRGIAYDSRLVEDGFLFVAIKGFCLDGHDYIKNALSKGATGVVVEKTIDLGETTVIEVEDTRRTLALLSANFYAEPSQRLSLVGITGTNGKTTTSYIIKSILEAWGRKTGLIGTIQYITGRRVVPATQTTPESLDMQRYLREMVDNDIEYAILEVSSHALALKRVEGCSFKIAVFTNFSQDHLDFHGTMQDYFETKAMLFNYLERDGYAILNLDDPMVGSLFGRLKCNVLTCGIHEGAVIKAQNITDYRHQTTDNRHWTGLSFDIKTPDERFTVHSGLVGMNNVYNILMSVGVAYALGVNTEAIIKGIADVREVKGRFEKIEEGQDFLCIVDYAHTEDALRNLITEARHITKGRIITVFGCGGDRDRLKRPRMGFAATDLSDFVIITSDNPRTEDPIEIIKEITAGIKKDNFIVEVDRALAIEKAVSLARAGDTLLVAGKGHEDYQEVKGVRYPFSDKEVLKRAIKNRG